MQGGNYIFIDKDQEDPGWITRYILLHIIITLLLIKLKQIKNI